jgi:hypothetical protein
MQQYFGYVVVVSFIGGGTSDKEIIIELIRIGSLVHHVFLHLHIFTKN